jgi:hypothetical protein
MHRHRIWLAFLVLFHGECAKVGLSCVNVMRMNMTIQCGQSLVLPGRGTPIAIFSSDRDLLLDQFARSDYRLGNILDRWFAVHICRVLKRCDENLERKFESELEDMTTRAPKGSIAKFLMRNSPGPRKIPVKFFHSFNQTKFAQTYSWFWIYSYDAVGEVLDTFRISLSHNLQQYGEMIRAPWYFKPYYLDVNTCVIHYRLGDMLSHAHFLDSVDFSRQLHQWAVLEGLNILTFQVLSSGGISFRASGAEVSQSRTLLDIFLNTTQQLFPEADILTFDQGTPDEDWMRMVMSPMLFTSHGSYVISAAALNIGRRGTPAIENSNFPGCGSRASGYLVPGWYLFPCKNFDASSSAGLESLAGAGLEVANHSIPM